jgi:hypothetical protein
MHLDGKPGRSGRLSCLPAVALALLVAGCGGDKEAKPKLAWVAAPKIIRQPELPRDRIAIGEVRNESEQKLRLDADRARVVDAAGHRLRSAVRFSRSFGHGLYSPRRFPSKSEPEFERRRLGALAVIEPGKTAPLTVSWRVSRTGARAAKLLVGGVAVELPESG